MKRRLLGFAMFLPLLVCILGADTIGWDAGYPLPNPGGTPNQAEGKGPYSIDPANSGGGAYFHLQKGKFESITGAAFITEKGQTKWQCIGAGFGAGTYDSWGLLSSLDKDGNLNTTKTTKVSIVIK